ncbi:MAG: AIM24 family protein, partial [Cyanobacteria bacterium HKST-UBA06]|nr:AIM24 family protein [Cyanobacteria bacterium HKST-UBA06]
AFPGKIIPLDLSTMGGEILCQKNSFLCAAKGVGISLGFTKRLGAGFFGGEGFILQKLVGDGLAFAHAGGTIVRRELAAGEQIKVDTGCLVALTGSVSYDITLAKGIKTMLFGGEGLFLATLEGPGTVWLQSLPFSRLASNVFAAIPPDQIRSTQTQGEGSVLGHLGSVLAGDRGF